MFRKGFFASLFSGLRGVIFSLLVVGVIFVSVLQTDEANRAEGVRLLEEAITRAAIHNYAAFGYFPESLSYIVENYGIHVDTTRFVVHYEVFASNIMPDIQVFELRGTP